MTVLTDTRLPDEPRIEVVDELGPSLSRRDEFIEALLAILTDPNDSPAVREAALQALGSAAFQVVRFQPYHRVYNDALHDLVADPVSALRQAAVSTLAHECDPVFQETLLQGLRATVCYRPSASAPSCCRPRTITSTTCRGCGSCTAAESAREQACASWAPTWTPGRHSKASCGTSAWRPAYASNAGSH